MSEQAVKEVIQRAVTDETFRALLFSDPAKALEGYDLTNEERATLEDLDEEKLTKGGKLGDRSTKGWVPGAG
ncbi:MAG: Os1348 family NHLP clan protein [Anaerolineae bacterium]